MKKTKSLIVSIVASVIFLTVPFPAFAGTAKDEGLYVNKRFLFQIQNPQGWNNPVETLNKDGSMKVVFSKAKGEDLPQVVISTDLLGRFESTLEYTNFVIERLRGLYAKTDFEMKVLEEPREVELRKLKCIRLVYELSGPANIKFIDYKFTNGPLVICFTGYDNAGDFDKSKDTFERMVESFRFNGKELSDNGAAKADSV